MTQFIENNDIIFTTAYKDINRGNWVNFTRSNQTYINYFYNLADNIKYKLVVYVEDYIKETMFREHVFNENIIFIDMNDVETFYQKFLEKDTTVMNSEAFQNKIPQNRKNKPECLYSEYNLINHSKINFVNHTKKLFGDYKYYSWIDFGTMNENVENIPNNIDTFLLDKKITYHCVQEPPLERISEDEMLKSDEVYFLGSSFIVFRDLVEKFEKAWETKLIEWQEKTISDDDQNLVLQLYYDCPDMFQKIKNAEWFGMFRKLKLFDETKNTPLCEIMGRNKSDKGSINIVSHWHNYTTFYYNLFKDMQEQNLRIFELGLGTNNVGIPSNMGINGRPGASLYGWCEFFSNSYIFGADIDSNILFDTDKIKTFYCDQTNPDVIKQLWDNINLQENFDIIIEDGLHTFEANKCFFENSIHKIKPNGYYIIEDILNEDIPLFISQIKDWELTYNNYIFHLFTIPSIVNKDDNTLLVVRKL
jgi:hypothetical protein